MPGAKPKADMAQLDRELLELVEKLKPTEEERARQVGGKGASDTDTV